jgi:hypothetical protein
MAIETVLRKTSVGNQRFIYCSFSFIRLYPVLVFATELIAIGWHFMTSIGLHHNTKDGIPFYFLTTVLGGIDKNLCPINR